ncbi:MAG: zinc-ribbon domain-containing protein [Patescibacteria group bacterium]
MTICPQCGKPAGEGKFCNNCGASLTMAKCPKCGAQNSAASRFCGECGTRIG